MPSCFIPGIARANLGARSCFTHRIDVTAMTRARSASVIPRATVGNELLAARRQYDA